MKKDYQQLNEKKIYIISPYGLGDTYILCMFKDALEKYYEASVVYVIKASHVSVVELFGFEYVVQTFSPEELQDIADKQSGIEAGKLFVAHPHYVSIKTEEAFVKHEISFLEMYRRTLGLPENVQATLKTTYPEVTEELREKVKPYEIEEIVLFAPELTSCFTLIDKPSPYWIQAYNEELAEKTDALVLNVLEVKNRSLCGKIIDFTIRELIALAINCKEVITVRSGLCDLVYEKVKKMTVIYSDYDFWKTYSLADVFKGIIDNPNVREACIAYAARLREAGYSNCAIYGYGENGKRLHRTLLNQGFEVSYIIDRNAGNIKCDGKIVTPEEELTDVDCVLVATLNGFQEISEMLKNKLKCDIINFWDLDYKQTTEKLFWMR